MSIKDHFMFFLNKLINQAWEQSLDYKEQGDKQRHPLESYSNHVWSSPNMYINNSLKNKSKSNWDLKSYCFTNVLTFPVKLERMDCADWACDDIKQLQQKTQL